LPDHVCRRFQGAAGQHVYENNTNGFYVYTNFLCVLFSSDRIWSLKKHQQQPTDQHSIQISQNVKTRNAKQNKGNSQQQCRDIGKAYQYQNKRKI